MTNMRRIFRQYGAVFVITGLVGAGVISAHSPVSSPLAATIAAADHTAPAGRAADTRSALFFPAQTPFQHLATTSLLGAAIHDSSGKVIGDIEELILSTDHRIIGVIMGVGGALGFGEKKIAVRMSALHFKRGDQKTFITLNVSEDDIDNAPAYKAKTIKKSLIERGAEATRKVLKKAAQKTSETVSKAREATRKAVEPAKPAK